jgi:LCP family protein required for cell wall assembly
MTSEPPQTPAPAATDARGRGRRRRRRTWPQRLVLGFNLLLALACLAGAIALYIGQHDLGRAHRADTRLSDEQKAPIPNLVIESLIGGDSATTVITSPTTSTSTTLKASTTSSSSPASPPIPAENFLMTGSDSRECIDPNSPYAGAFLGEGTDVGTRTDTIMILRVEPSTGRAAILSFPRDLWVPLAGTNRKGKINSAIDKTDPTRLIGTIETYFGIHVDHYINIDFCVFKDLVDAVGGVSVPFKTPVRDKHTGLDVPAKGCFKFSGDHALAYVRSRYIQYQDDAGKWHSEGTSDIGRIRRQQDFLRRVMQKVRSKGVLDLRFINRMVDTFIKRVEIDLDLTINDLLHLADAMKNFDPATTRSFIIEGQFGYKGNQAVVNPVLDTPTMQTILSIFQGKASVSDAPDEQQQPITSDATTVPPSTQGITTLPGTPTTVSPFPTTTLEEVDVVDNADTAYGATNAVVPDKDVVCP